MSLLWKLIDKFGNKHRFSLAVHKPNALIESWVKKDFIPERNALTVERLGVGVTCKQVCEEAERVREEK